MKKTFLTLIILSVSILIRSQNENPFAKFGYDVLVATSSKGEFTEFHDQTDIVEIGSVLFDTRTNEIIKVLEIDETTINISSATAAMSIDPLCEKYYWISPYVYVANNPIKLIDPDGRDIKMYYQQGGKNHAFIFNGSNYSSAPNNAFVQGALKSYKYNVENGGGESMQSLAENKDLTVKLIEAKYGSSYQQGDAVFWDPSEAIKTAEGHVMSPATALEHEMSHVKNYLTDKDAQKARVRTSDNQYGNAEEKKVITGAEAKTAQSNGEFPKGYVRGDHKDHGSIRVNDPTKTSTTSTPSQTKQNSSSLLQRFKDWWNN